MSRANKRYFVFCALFDIPVEILNMAVVGQCHGFQVFASNLTIKENDMTCGILVSLYTSCLCCLAATFSFAILYRYERLLMVLKGTRRHAFMKKWKKWLLASIFLLALQVILMSGLGIGAKILLMQLSTQDLGLVVAAAIFFSWAVITISSVICSDLYCIYEMFG